MTAPVNRSPKNSSPAALVALARTRRMQRALAHAYLFRGSALPTLRTSLGYMTGTACTADGEAADGYAMRILGLARAESVVYVVEEHAHATDEAPIVYRLYIDGPRVGHLVPVHAWYEPPVDAKEVRARIASIAATLEEVGESTPEAWMLSTRIVQRRALRLAPEPNALPVRKFALQLQVEPVGSLGPHGKTTVTAFLRPNAELVAVSSLSTGDAVARVRYTGVPSGLGLAKETVIFLGRVPGM
jgi:hypothetical protein